MLTNPPDRVNVSQAMQVTALDPRQTQLKWPALIELLKPITWFPPMWAFGCGLVSAGVPLTDRWWLVAGGMIVTIIMATIINA